MTAPLTPKLAEARATLIEATYGEFSRPCPEREACADALIAAAFAEVVGWLTEESTVEHLAHRVDDVSPNRTFREDIEDARVYCNTLADYVLTRLRNDT